MSCRSQTNSRCGASECCETATYANLKLTRSRLRGRSGSIATGDPARPNGNAAITHLQGFAADSPLEEAGFEPSVPAVTSSVGAPCHSVSGEECGTGADAAFDRAFSCSDERGQQPLCRSHVQSPKHHADKVMRWKFEVTKIMRPSTIIGHPWDSPRKSGSPRTLCWRKPDSNLRSRVTRPRS
jgi:hypothetical protein